MPATVIRGAQVLDGTIQRTDLDIVTTGQAVVSKLIQGSGITLNSTGADAGTGDVTISAAAGFISKTTTYTLTSADSGKYVICSGGSWTLTLPTAAAGLFYRVRNDMGITGTVGTITIARAGAATIDGATSIALLPQQECTILTDGTNWRTYGLKREVVLGTQDITSSTASSTVLLPVGYRYFELQFSGVLPVTSGDYLIGQFSVNAGSTWATTLYYLGLLYNPTTTTAGYSQSDNVGSFYIVPGGFNAAPIAGQSKLIIYPGNATIGATAIADAYTRAAGSITVKWQSSALWNSSGGPINAVKYFMSTGNIANLFVTVKGVV